MVSRRFNHTTNRRPELSFKKDEKTPCAFWAIWYSIDMKIKNIQEVAAEVAEVHGKDLSGTKMEDVLIAAWIKNMRQVYPRFCMCVSHNSADMDTAGDLIEAYKNIAK